MKGQWSVMGLFTRILARRTAYSSVVAPTIARISVPERAPVVAEEHVAARVTVVPASSGSAFRHDECAVKHRTPAAAAKCRNRTTTSRHEAQLAG